MADSINPEDTGSGMLRNAARAEKYRPEYNKVAIAAMEAGTEPPPFEKWVADRISQEQSAATTGVMQRLRKFVAK